MFFESHVPAQGGRHIVRQGVDRVLAAGLCDDALFAAHRIVEFYQRIVEVFPLYAVIIMPDGDGCRSLRIEPVVLACRATAEHCGRQTKQDYKRNVSLLFEYCTLPMEQENMITP